MLRRGRIGGRFVYGDFDFWISLFFFIRLFRGGSLFDFVRGLIVFKCVIFSIVCGGWFCGEKGLLYFLWLFCIKFVRKENVKY